MVEHVLRRRNILGGLGCLSIAFAACLPPLKALAQRRNRLFGTDVRLVEVVKFPTYAALVARECDIITPGVEAKWGYVEPRQACIEFADIDNLVKFARSNALKLHMFNLVWDVGIPRWAARAVMDGQSVKALKTHIDRVVGRYCGRIHSWDVINEPIEPRWPSASDGSCLTLWRQRLDFDYIMRAFHLAAAADPNAMLVINDDDLDYDLPEQDTKQTTYLRVIERLPRHGVPITWFGLETHLKPWLTFTYTKYRTFLRELG